jgi:predicted nucleotide-binding protein (sugar kinase/HSP70/actin superfamily)
MVCFKSQKSKVKSQKSLKFGCPKAIGLPDMVRAIFSDIPQMIDLTIDEQLMHQRQSFLEIGRLFTKDNKRIREAWDLALIEQEKYSSFLLQGLRPSEVFTQNLTVNNIKYDSDIPKIGLIGHPYLIYDDLLSLSLFDTIEKLGIHVLPVSSVYKATIENSKFEIRNSKLLDDVHWVYEQDIIGSTAHFLRQNSVSGLLFAFSFSCGTSAVTTEIIRKELLDFYDIPSLTLLFDEHTAPAGLLTRIESFVDLLSRKPNTIRRL